MISICFAKVIASFVKIRKKIFCCTKQYNNEDNLKKNLHLYSTVITLPFSIGILCEINADEEIMPMSGKKEKSQRQIRFPYCGAVAVIWPTAEITRILGGLMNCMSAAMILTASPMLPSRVPMVWLCVISPPRSCTLYLILVKIRYKMPK